MTNRQYRVAIIFPADENEGLSTNLKRSRLANVAMALRGAGIEVVGAPFADHLVEHVRDRLLGVDGVLVWINPIQGGHDRSVLNAMLTEIASRGVFVSAHPDVITKMGTKEVLYRTRTMNWGGDIRHYPTLHAMQSELPACLASGHARVLKQIRGQSGDGVWKVECAHRVSDAAAVLLLRTPVRVRHAIRGSLDEEMPLEQFIARCAPYFETGGMIDQAYQPRLREGMVRCYLVRNRVEGFGEQLLNALYPAADGADPSTAPQPGARLYYPPSRADFQTLKDKMEREWIAELCHILTLEPKMLPMIWDADFLYGPRDCEGADTFVLCEINVSSVFPFPDDALAPLAAAMVAELKGRRLR